MQAKSALSRLIYGVVVIVPALWLAYLWVALSVTTPSWIPGWLQLPSDTAGREVLALRGQLGDTFGVFNSLVSVFALLGLIFTIHTQQRQIASQEDHARAAHRLMRQQQFQQQLFQAIEAYRSLLADIVVECAADRAPSDTCSGRAALQALRQEMISRLPRDHCEQLREAVTEQADSFCRQLTVYRQRKIEQAIRDLEQWLTQDVRHLEIARTCIGQAWSSIYAQHRFQLDALFRAWYTVYRILETATDYEIEESDILLYAATFRARLSWIEMALLIVNQSGRGSDEFYPAYPRACRYANRFAVFENMDTRLDVVVTILKAVAMHASEAQQPDNAVLTRRAFGEGDNIKSTAAFA